MGKIIENYAQAGVKGISVWRDRLADKSPVQLGEEIRKAEIEIVSLVRGGFFPGKTEAERNAAIDENRLIIDEAAGLGAPMLVLVCGAVPGQAIRQSLDQIEKGLATILPCAEKNGVKLVIEPLHPMYADSRSAIATMKTANDFAEKFDSPFLGVAVDVFHVWWDPDLEAEIKRCGDNGKLMAFHICDWKQDMEDMLNDRGLMGEGIIRIGEIRCWMENSGFNGFHEVEIFSNRWWNTDQNYFLQKIKKAYLQI
ncbi:MAG TPA: sugar phosphate isomerase/epimerase [Bacteroidetes bacterium]|nr:sugar phosphate isomerase/epimerase [Bacteroidota bacterium]